MSRTPPQSPRSIPHGAEVINSPHAPRRSGTLPLRKESDPRRLPAFDVLRVAAMVLVVIVHAAIPYTHIQIRQLLWSIREPGPDLTFDWISWWILGVALPVFFVLGGFAAESLRASRGWHGFVRDRWRRVGVPLLVAVPVVLTPTLLVWNYGWHVIGRTSDSQFLRFLAPDAITRANRYGPAHLWFLEYLAVWLVVYALVTRPGSAWHGRFPSRWAGLLLRSGIAPFVLAIPTTVILWANHERFGLDAVMDMRNSFGINGTRWLHHGVFFWVGVALAKTPNPWPALAARGPWFLLASLLAFALRAFTLGHDLRSPLQGLQVWGLCGSAAAFGWLTTFAALGCAVRWWGRRDGPVLRYLSDVSFWVYLVHFPLVGLIQANLYHVAWPLSAKFSVTLFLSLGISLLSYQVIARHSAIGRWLHGARVRHPHVPAPEFNVPASTRSARGAATRG